MIGRSLWLKGYIDQRAAVRFAFTCPGTVTVGRRAAAGILTNLSVWGCALRTHIVAAPGDRVSVTLAFHEEDVPLVLELSRVRWVQSDMVGIEFLNMAASARARLRRRLLILREEWVSLQRGAGGVRSQE